MARRTDAEDLRTVVLLRLACTGADKRPGMKAFLRWLDTTDFYTAPASANHHGAHPGGLAQHSIGVELVLQRMTATMPCVDYKADSACFCALFHDLCKIDTYELTGDGYIFNPKLNIGHGEKSLYYIRKYIDLNPAEAAAIRWHMGLYSDPDKVKEISGIYRKYPLALALHTADMWASSYMEEQGK